MSETAINKSFFEVFPKWYRMRLYPIFQGSKDRKPGYTQKNRQTGNQSFCRQTHTRSDDRADGGDAVGSFFTDCRDKGAL